MDQEKKLHMYVYRSVLIDIFNDVYIYNTKLPTLPRLCEVYNVGRNTVRSALLKLQEDGYISMQRGTRAIVIFNHEDVDLHRQYVQTLSNLKRSISDAFETMGCIFPSIGALALKNATNEQIELLLNQVDNFDIDNIQNEVQLVKELFEIYEIGFSFLNNPILDDLITTILYSIYLPAYTNVNQKKSQKSVKKIQATLKILIKSKNSFIIRNSISGLCHSYGRQVVEHIENICEGTEPIENKEFIWTIHHDEDYLYMQVVTQIINDINNKVYVKGDLLPSIAQLAIQYNVSERTSRRALEALREYRIIQTVNGIGSRIVINTFKNNTRLLKNPKVKHHIQAYYDSSMLIMMINDVVIPKVLKSVSDEELKSIVSLIKDSEYFSLVSLYEFIYSQTNQCLCTIYKELAKYKVWGYFINILVEVDTEKSLHKKEMLLEALENRDATKVIVLIREIIELSLSMIEKK